MVRTDDQVIQGWVFDTLQQCTIRDVDLVMLGVSRTALSAPLM